MKTNIKTEKKVMETIKLLLKAGISKNNITVFILIGYKDTPEDALYRLKTIKSKKIYTFPMRYQPLDCKKYNNYVSKNWTNKQLIDFQRYWSNYRFFRNIPFSEYEGRKK